MSRPDPLVPAECTMAGNDWFPLHFDRLRKSKWWRRATDLARARNIMMWGEAYKQVPAGSLPDDDDDLAEAAGFGMDIDAFIAAKAEIMAPWVLCEDGRWYHPTVCEVVLEAWERKSEQRKAAAAKKAAQRAKTRGQAPIETHVPTESADVPIDDVDVPRDTAKSEGDIDTQYSTDRTGQTEPPLPPIGGDELFALQPEESSADPVEEAFRLWNETADRCGLPRAKVLDDARRKAIRKRLEAGGVEGWREAMEAVTVSSFCRGLRPGSDGRTFRADLTFVCQAKSYQRLVEGGYGRDAEPPKPRAAAAPSPKPGDEWRHRIAAYQRNAFWNRLEWGAQPGREGCAAPPEIQREFGIEPAPPQAIRGAA